MKQFVLIAFLVGWFFSYKAPLPGAPGAFLSSIIGPFPSKEICQAHYDEAYDMFTKMEVPGMRMQRCIEDKEA
jgi:hypothetical protein